MTRTFTQLKGKILCDRLFSAIGLFLLVLALAATAIAQTPPPTTYPPALPATTGSLETGGFFGATLTQPGLTQPSFSPPSSTIWQPFGPAPLTENGGGASGRIAGVAVDPTNNLNIYVAAAGGGVWKSTDGGVTYTPLTDTQTTLSMGAIAIASNGTTLYAGTGEANNSLDSNYGAGILVSTNSGASWTLNTGPGGVFASSRLSVSKISIDPTTPTTAYAAMNDYSENAVCGGFLCVNTGIYKTTNGGASWTNITSAAGLDSDYPWSDVVVDPNNNQIIYAAHGDIFANSSANGVYRSTNAGSTWALLTGAPNGNGFGRVALAVGASANVTNQHVLYVAISQTTGNGGMLYEMLVSNNADSVTPTFANMTSTPNFGGSGGQGWYDWIIAVDPANANNVYAAGAFTYGSPNTLGIIRSTNGTLGTSATWTDITTVGGIQPHTDSHAMTFDNSSNLLFGNDGGLWRFNISGPSYTNLNGNLNTIQFTGIGLHPTNNQIVVGGSQDNGTELSTGNNPWLSTDGGDGGYSQFAWSSASALTCYSNHPIGSFGSTAFFRVSTDGCNNFVARTPTISNSNLFNFYAPIFVDQSSVDSGLRVFLGGDKLYESTNAGASWTNHTNPATTAINSIAASGSTIYISTGGTLSSSNPQIWVSTNDGSSWAQVSLPLVATKTVGAVQEVDIDPNDATGNTVVAVINSYQAFSAASGQIYRTTNGGTLWTNISGNLPLLPTWSAKIDTDANKTIYISNETGVYSSPSPYGVWTQVGTGLPNAQGVHLELNHSLSLLAVGTHGRGAWYISTAPTLTSPTLTKSFSPATIQSGGNSLVTLLLNNPNATQLTGGTLSDTLVGMSAVAGALGGTCTTTTPSLTTGQTVLNFTGITIPASTTCTITFTVTSTTIGSNNNTTTGITTTQTPTAGAVSNTAALLVLAPPTITKAFNPTSIVSGGTSVVTLTISNTANTTTTLTGGQVTDTLLSMSTVNGNVTGTCGASPASFTAGQTTLTFTNITIPQGLTCTIIFSVTSTNIASNPNTTSGVTTTQTPTAGTVSNTANLTVTALSAPSISKAFGGPTMPINGTTSLTFTITNPNAGTSLTNVAFTDTLPAGLVVATPNGLTGTCGGGAITATSGTGSVSLATATLAASTSCTFSVNVLGTTSGVKNNSVQVTSTEGGTGNTSTASVTVVSAPSITKTFGAPSITLNGTTSLAFGIINSNQSIAFTGVAFTDSLPAGLVVAPTPGVTNSCNGTVTAVAGSSSVTLSAGTLATATSCAITVNVQGTTTGTKNNSVQVTSNEGGTGNTSNASVNVLLATAPAITKTFGAASIALNGTTSLSFSITNPNAGTSLTNVAFTDTLPAGLVVATPNGLTGTCGGGAITATSGTGSVSLATATLAASTSCTFSVNVQGTTSGVKNNSVQVTSTEGGAGNTSTASVTVVSAPSITKTFGAPSITLNGTTSLTFSITNPNAASSLSGVAFTDSLPPGLVVASPNGLTGTCGGGTITATSGTGSVSLATATLAASASCTFSVNVQGTTTGTKNNSVQVTSNEGGTGNTSNASVNVGLATAPSITKSFGAASIALNGTTSLTFSITNPNAGTSLTNVAFTDTLPAGLVVATPNGLTGTCGGGAITATAGTGSVSLATATLAASATCNFSVNVQGTTSGVKNNSVLVTSTEGGTGNTSTASVTVASPPSITKTFGAGSITLNGTTSLTFSISNPNAASSLTGLSFIDTLPAGLIVATPNGLTTTCTGTTTATAGSGSVTLSAGTLAANASCSISLNVQGTTLGMKNNSVTITSTEGGTGNTSNASVNVVNSTPPSITKTFGAASITLNGTTSLTFSISNPNAASSLTGLSFIDTLPAGLVVATPNGLTTTCTGTTTATAGSGSVSLSAGTLTANSSCTISLNVQGTTLGTKNNSVTITSTEGGTGNTSNASVNVVNSTPPVITKSFGAASILLNGTTSLTFSISNPNLASSLTGLAFTDTLPAGLIVATPNGLSNTCGGIATATAGTGSASLATGSLTANSSCTISLNVQGTTTGTKNNSVTITSTEGGTGNTSNASVNVTTTTAVTNVTSTAANGSYKAGAVIPIQVSFSAIVNVTGTPQLALNSGGTASYTSGSGTSTLTFTYTVAPGQNSAHLDYVSTAALSTNGGSILDNSSNPANLTLPAPGSAGSLSANKNIVIDTVAPTVVSYSVLFGSTSFNMASSTRNRLPWQITGVQVVFSEPVIATAASFSGLTATGVSGSGTNTVTWTLSPISNLPVTLTSILGTTANAVTDIAGNPLGGGTNFNQNLKVLWGDFNDDGVVNSQDLVGVNAARSQTYNIFADLNGDGVVDINDVNIVRSNLGLTNQP